MPQLTIAADPAIALAGQIAFPMFARWVYSYVVSQVGGIGFGQLVSRITSDTQVKLPAAGGDVTATAIGISVRQTFREYIAAGYDDKHVIPVLTFGQIWVAVEGAVTAEGIAYARHTANGGNTTLGLFRADTDSGNAAAVPNAKFKTSTTAAGLAIVELR